MFVKDNFYYIFVYIGSQGEYPEFYIVPSKVASNIVKETASKYFSNKRRDGKDRVDLGMRHIGAEEVKDYKDKWQLLQD